MKRSKKIYFLLCILAVTSIATYAVKQLEEHKEKIKNREEIILEIPIDSVNALSWQYESENLAFHKDEEWIYDEDESFPVDEEKINELLALFEELKASFIIEEARDYGQYGLDDPICTINLSTDEKSYEILLGDYSIMDSQRYISIGDGNVYLVKDDPMDYFAVVLSDLIDNDETPTFNDNVTKIQFKGVEDYHIIYEEDSANTYSDNDVYFAQRNGKSLPLDTHRVNSYLRKITHLDLTDYVTYKASEEELRKYGLDEPELMVTVAYTTENEEGKEISDTFVLNISRDPEEKKAAEKISKKDNDNSEEEKITAYVRVGNSKIIYKISSDDYRDLMAASYDSFRHLEVFHGDFESIQQLDVSLEGTNYTITSEKKGDKRTYYYKEEELELVDFQRALENLKADSFTNQRPTQKKEISLKLYLDNENYPEVHIDLYRYDGTYCLAVVDGEPISLIKRSNVVDLIETVHAIVLN
ncbi:DUF4340 domain-containing protein [Tepidimicrobium xylanilyticum]|uniref:DUF4340 domain-containing protein n=1 Tax=Tepidimicrobium xylanilyticum TaxID=1123352 RepID=UPI00264D844A|nr:DUF4340 domain-containing protein [Tepidimicrobium xylanilyticum]GMG96560.1 hypothetical protein EN5CB1_13860 [Tepidimicrobium xylanilyticum]